MEKMDKMTSFKTQHNHPSFSSSSFSSSFSSSSSSSNNNNNNNNNTTFICKGRYNYYCYFPFTFK